MAENTYHHGDLKNALIQAGIDILAQEGVKGLSLRKVARQAGVSHGAPYAHFKDKQALIAAISTDGFNKIYHRILNVMEQFPNDLLRQFIEIAWAYVDFGFTEPDHFRVTFSASVEKEREYPALVEMTGKTFNLIRSCICRCQDEGYIAQGDADLAALTVWSLVHGFVTLIQENMISHTVLERFTTRKMLLLSLNQILLQPLTTDPLDGTSLTE